MDVNAKSTNIAWPVSHVQKPASRLDQLLAIQGSGASDAEKRMMMRNIQSQMDSENVKVLMAHIPDSKNSSKGKHAEESSEEQTTVNADGDSAVISEESRQQFEQSQGEPGAGAVQS
jgi:hypothetical protein